MKKTNFCGIFATVFVAATVITLASCSQDDEFYEEGLFTRADEMMTRSGGEPGGYTPTEKSRYVFENDIPFTFTGEGESINTNVSFKIEVENKDLARGTTELLGCSDESLQDLKCRSRIILYKERNHVNCYINLTAIQIVPNDTLPYDVSLNDTLHYESSYSRNLALTLFSLQY